MEQLVVKYPGGKINHTIQLERSKSIANRALIMQALCQGEMKLHHLSNADDTVTLNALLQSNENLLDVGAAGTTMRFMVAYLSSNKDKEVIITGSERMQNRPIGVLVDALRDLGASIDYKEKEGYPPLAINGKSLDGGKLSIPANVSSQYISALLMIAPTLKNGLELTLEGEMVSIPYIQMTLNMMAYFGIQYNWTDNVITIENQVYQAKDFTVEADWSAASYWYEIMAFAEEGSELFLEGLGANSTQGDSVIADIMTDFGVSTEYVENGVLLKKGKALFEKKSLDLLKCPDLSQTLVSLYAAFGRDIQFEGLKTLKIKETDRVVALKQEWAKMNVSFTEDQTDVLWSLAGEMNTLNDAIDTYEDHRMAMAFAPLAMKQDQVVINEPMVVTKSYPNYWKDLASVGFQLEEQ